MTPVIFAVVAITPGGGFLVEAGQVGERPAGKEIAFYKADHAFYRTLGKRMPGLAEAGLETDRFHEGGLVVLPNRRTIRIPADYDAFHIVRQHPTRNAQFSKSMDDADEKRFLAGIWEKLNENRSAVMADHDEAGNTRPVALWADHIDEPPVHLVAVTWPGTVPTASISLRQAQTPHWRQQMPVAGNVGLDCRQTSFVAGIMQALEAHIGIGNAGLEQVIQDFRIAVKDPWPAFAGVPVGFVDKTLLLEPSQAASGNAGTAFQFCEIYFLRIKIPSMIPVHFLKNRG